MGRLECLEKDLRTILGKMDLLPEELKGVTHKNVSQKTGKINWDNSLKQEFERLETSAMRSYGYCRNVRDRLIPNLIK